jgi:hypothetical protein
LKSRSLKSFASRKFLSDAASMGVFWTIVYTPVFLFTSKSLDAALIGLVAAAILEVSLGGVYGKFNDWFRVKAGVNNEETS